MDGKLGNPAQAAIAFVEAGKTTPHALLEAHPEGTPGRAIAEAAVRRARRHPVQEQPVFVGVSDEGLADLVTVTFTGEVGRLQDEPGSAFAKSLLADRWGRGRAEGQPVAVAVAVTVAVVDLEAGTFATVEVRMEALADLGPEEVAVFHLEQQLGDDVVTGGYTVAVAQAVMPNPSPRSERGTTMETTAHQQDLLDLVVAEVDEARDVYELAQQLEPLLPIKSFDQLVEAAGDRELKFRDANFCVESLRGVVPDLLFPVGDAGDLVRRLGQVVRAVPESLALDLEGAEGGRRIRRRQVDAALRSNGGRPNAVAIGLPINAKPDDEGLPQSPAQLSE